MTVKRNALVVQTAHSHQLVDTTQDWRAIYDRLSAEIGEQNAYAWFGHCRFVELSNSSRLELAQWNGFTASECLKRYGAELAKAADVTMVRVYRSGGFVPTCIANQPKKRSGYVMYRTKEFGAELMAG